MKALSIYVLLFNFSFCIIAQTSINVELKYSTYYGGNEGDDARGIATDNDDSFYLFGHTLSTNLPTNSNSFQDTLKGSYDVFVSKFDSSGIHIWTTYIGGSNIDMSSTIKTTNDNKLILIGYTNSPDFPTTAGAYQTNIAGGYDVFIIKLDTNGQIIWSSLYGGNGGELGIDAAIDANNNILIAGQTNSSDFPFTAGAFQPLPLGGNDSFLAKFNPAGQLIWATCYGGTSTEDAHAITCDYENNVVITGMTSSNDLTISANAVQTNNNGFFDIYIAKFSENGNYIWSTYYGGTNYDDIFSVHCDSANNLYFAGLTSSIDFETTPNAFQTSKNNGSDGCLFKLNKHGTLIWSTYIGGNNDDYANKIILDKNNNVTTLINSNSTSNTLHADTLLTNTPYSDHNSYFITLDTSGIPIWSTMFGGDGTVNAYDLKITPGGKLYFTGTTSSNNIPITNDAFQENINAFNDCFAAILQSPLYYTDTTNVPNKIKLHLLENSIELFPNPAFDKLYLKNVTYIHYVIIYSIRGEKIKSIYRPNNTIDITELTQGTYIIEFYSEEKIEKKLFIKL